MIKFEKYQNGYEIVLNGKVLGICTKVENGKWAAHNKRHFVVGKTRKSAAMQLKNLLLIG